MVLVHSAETDAKRITVEVDDGKVILCGTVRAWAERQEAERQEAERVAWSAPGVTSVENHSTITLYPNAPSTSCRFTSKQSVEPAAEGASWGCVRAARSTDWFKVEPGSVSASPTILHPVVHRTSRVTGY